MREHKFSTPDGNKTYCKTCGYTEQAGNHPDADRERREMVQAGQPERDLTVEVLTGGQTWTTEELQRDFEVMGFAAPFVVARRRSDGQLGSLEFTNRPRVYFGWKPDEQP